MFIHVYTIGKSSTPSPEVSRTRRVLPSGVNIARCWLQRRFTIQIDDELGGHGSMLVDLTEYWSACFVFRAEGEELTDSICNT